MSAVIVENVVKHYGTMAALNDVSVRFADGEFFGLLGPSGSGKTTLLRAIAGFVVPDAGTISIGGERVENVPVHRRSIGMVFQNYALFPHMTVADNVAFGLQMRSVAAVEIRRRVGEMLELVHLSGFEARKPRQLSGGQQQRIALARALITRPKVLLLDEPLGALDRRLRQEMQVELRQIQREVGITTIFVTHDQEEALTLSDRVAIINGGKIAQIGLPQEVYERPETVFAAQFLGDANVLSGEAAPGGFALRDGTLIQVSGGGGGGTGHKTAIVRPEKLTVAKAGEPISETLRNRLQGQILQAVYSGNSITYRVQAPAAGPTPILAFVQNRSADLLEPGAAVTLAWSPDQTVPIRD